MRPSPLATLGRPPRATRPGACRTAPCSSAGPATPRGEGTGQSLLAAVLRAGRTPRHWSAPPAPGAALDAKADALAVLSALGVPPESLSVTADSAPHYHPGRSGTVRQGPRLVLARFGALHPRVLSALGLEAAAACEVFLDALPDPKRRRRAAPELSAFQPVRRDFAFVAAPDVAAEAVLRAARGADRALIAGATLFDVFEGGTLAAGERSLGVEVVFQPRERTLTEAELEAASARVVAAVAKATGATLR